MAPLGLAFRGAPVAHLGPSLWFTCTCFPTFFAVWPEDNSLWVMLLWILLCPFPEFYQKSNCQIGCKFKVTPPPPYAVNISQGLTSTPYVSDVLFIMMFPPVVCGLLNQPLCTVMYSGLCSMWVGRLLQSPASLLSLGQILWCWTCYGGEASTTPSFFSASNGQGLWTLPPSQYPIQLVGIVNILRFSDVVERYSS